MLPVLDRDDSRGTTIPDEKTASIRGTSQRFDNTQSELVIGSPRPGVVYDGSTRLWYLGLGLRLAGPEYRD